MKKGIIILAVVVVVLFIVGGCKIMLENYVNIRGQHLNKYRYGVGGGMDGGYRSETVKRYGDRAMIILESAEWYAQDPTVKEYLADAAVLDEIESIVRKYRMNFWNRKKFTNQFVADGESESYSFDFDEEDISFSSQIYPLRYSKKLTEIGKVIKKHLENAERLPGLANPGRGEEDFFLPENELIIYVYTYADNTLGLRILNGTDEDVEIAETYELVNVDTGVVLLKEETPYGGIFSEHSRDEMNIGLKERLSPGRYKIIFGGMDIPFEIR